MTWFTRPRSSWVRRAVPVVSAGALLALAAGCGNGLQTTAAGSAVPSQAVPAQTSASPTSAASPTDDTSSSSPSADDHGSGGSGSDDHSASSSPTTGTTGTCTLGDLKIGVKTADGGGAAGSNYVLLTFANTSSSACDLYGYPGVAFVGNDDGTQLGAQATRSNGDRSKVVKLAAGDTTTALLQIVNAGNFDAKDCAPTTADGFRIYPPASTKSAYVPFTTQACQRAGIRQLNVSPVGTSG